MAIPYLVTGNNLFKQWCSDESIIETFENWSKINSRVSCPFNLENANLLNICWSYNVFQNKDGYYITGVWGDNKNVVTKLDIFEKPLDMSDLIITSNDYKFYVVDTKLLKVWKINVGETLKHPPLPLIFDIPSETESESEFEIPQLMKISKVISSNNSIIFLTKCGQVFSGVPPVHVNTDHCVGEVCDIVCGYDHFILLTTVGQVYTWGCGQRFQLGHEVKSCAYSPTEVKGLIGLKITKIAAGGLHSLALSEFGDIYAWGWNDDGQLGVKPEQETKDHAGIPSCKTPTAVDIIDENGKQVELKVVDIACGSRHSAIKLEDNSLWVTGFNKYGQLGLPSKIYRSVRYFQKVLQCDIDFELKCNTWATVLLKK